MFFNHDDDEKNQHLYESPHKLHESKQILRCETYHLHQQHVKSIRGGICDR
jgi:hypothetical protein